MGGPTLAVDVQQPVEGVEMDEILSHTFSHTAFILPFITLYPSGAHPLSVPRCSRVLYTTYSSPTPSRLYPSHHSRRGGP